MNSLRQCKFSLSRHADLVISSNKVSVGFLVSVIPRSAFFISLLFSLSMALPLLSHAEAPLIDLASEHEKIVAEENKQTPSASSTQSPATVATPVAPNHSATSATPSAAQMAMPAKKELHSAQWRYSGEVGPQHWGDLSSSYALCSQGKNQSPIDLRETTAIGAQGLPELDIRYRTVPLKILQDENGLEIKYPLGSYIKVGGKRYELLHYQFHTPSEHQKEGFNYPMEVQLVHRDGDGNTVIMAILFQEGKENPQINTLLQNLPKEMGKLELHDKVSLNPVDFLPVNTEFFKYSGSLTQPPCTEGVYWMVFKQPIEASARQLMQLNERLGENARPVQKLYSRGVLKSWLEIEEDRQLYEFY